MDISIEEYRKKASCYSYDDLRSTLSKIGKEKYPERASCLIRLNHSSTHLFNTDTEQKK